MDERKGEITLRGGGQLEQVEGPGLGELLNRYIETLDASAATKRTYRKGVERFFQYMAEKGGPDGAYLQGADFLFYKQYLMKQYAASTVNAYLTAIRGFMRFMERESLLLNAAAYVPKGAKKAPGYKKDYLSKEQLKAVLDGIELDTVEGLRDYAMINLIARTGLRTIEVERANYEDIREPDGQPVLYVQGKGQEDRTEFVKLTPATYGPLQDYLTATGGRRPKDPVFQSTSNRTRGQRLKTRSIREIVKTRFKAAGIDSDRLSAHSLRHGAINYAIAEGADIMQVQGMARHKNINTTLVYARVQQRMERAAEDAVDRYIDE